MSWDLSFDWIQFPWNRENLRVLLSPYFDFGIYRLQLHCCHNKTTTFMRGNTLLYQKHCFMFLIFWIRYSVWVIESIHNAMISSKNIDVYEETTTSFLPFNNPDHGNGSDKAIGSAGRSLQLEIIINIFVWTMCIVTILGNGLVIAVFAADNEVRSKVSNMYILNLAVPDFIVGINSLVFNNLYRMYGVWYYGEQVCKTYLIIDWATTTVSIGAIVLISYDRYVLVTKGLEYDKIQTQRKFYITSITLWTICFIRLWFPTLRMIIGEKSRQTTIRWSAVFHLNIYSKLS